VEINKARLYQDKLLRHSHAYLTRVDAINENTSIRDHFNYVKTELAPQQYKKYIGYYNFPQSTLSITDKVYEDQYRVFKTSDRIDEIEISSPKRAVEYSVFYKAYKEWLSLKGWDIYRKRTCNLVFIDMPSDGNGTPIFSEISINNCIDYKPISDGLLEYALFETSIGYVWVDSEKYMLFEKEDIQQENLSGVFLGLVLDEKPHNLGWTPCRQFWTSNFSGYFMKETSISGELADLDSYDFLYNGKDHNDIINIFPTKWTVRQECGYEQETTNHTCSSGFLVDKNGGALYDQNKERIVCPSCKGGDTVKFAGGVLIVDPPSSEVAQTTEPSGFVTIDPNVLDHINKELQLRERNIVESSTGDYISDNNQAKNEKQIQLSTESREAKLLKIAKNLDLFSEWFVKTTATLLYGDKFKAVNIDSGRRFYLETVNELKENFVHSVEKGLPQTIYLNDLDRIIDSDYRSDEKGKKEARMWLNLEPFVGKSFEQVAELKKSALITQLEWDYYRYFSQLKAKFESEFTSIKDFDFENENEADKISKIKIQLMDWLKEMTSLFVDGNNDANQNLNI
jgi:RNA polymerase subunit RPABC4/transcription elongation factor Spt4